MGRAPIYETNQQNQINWANMGKQRWTNGMSDLLPMFDSHLALWVPSHISAIGVALYIPSPVLSLNMSEIFSKGTKQFTYIHDLCLKHL